MEEHWVGELVHEILPIYAHVSVSTKCWLNLDNSNETPQYHNPLFNVNSPPTFTSFLTPNKICWKGQWYQLTGITKGQINFFFLTSQVNIDGAAI